MFYDRGFFYGKTLQEQVKVKGKQILKKTIKWVWVGYRMFGKVNLKCESDFD